MPTNQTETQPAPQIEPPRKRRITGRAALRVTSETTTRPDRDY